MNESNAEYTHITIAISLAITTYMLFTFIIGFISLSVGWLLNSVSEIYLIILALAPIVAFLLFHKFTKKFPEQMLITSVLWFTSAVIPIVEIKYILIIGGIYFALVSFKMMLMIYLHTSKPVSSRIFVLAIFSIDQLVKLYNQGQIPIIHISSFNAFFTIAIAGLALAYFFESRTIIKSNVDSFNAFESPLEEQSATKPFGIFALYFALFLYFILFGNMGTISYNLSLFLDFTYLFGPIVILGLLIICYSIKKDINFNNSGSINVVRISAVVLVVSLFFFPWFNSTMLFWLIGIITLIIIIDFSVDSIKYNKESHITSFIAISYILMVILIFIMLITELNVIFGLIAIIIAISVFASLSSQKKNLKSMILTFSSQTFISKQQVSVFNWKVRNQSLLLILIILLGGFGGILPSLMKTSTPIETNELRAMTYNLHFGLDPYAFDNIDRVSDFIVSESPSFIGLQEVTFHTPLNGYKNMMDALKINLSPNYPYYYYSETQTGILSNAFFSIYPITSAETITLEPTVAYQRNMLNLVLDIEGNSLRVIILHLTHVIEDKSNPDRVKQAEFVVNKINTLSKLPTIIMGDFNAWPDFPETQVFSNSYQDGWNITNPNSLGFTWPSLDPDQRIDYIFLDKSLNTTNCKVMLNTISDHLPLSCGFEF